MVIDKIQETLLSPKIVVYIPRDKTYTVLHYPTHLVGKYGLVFSLMQLGELYCGLAFYG